MPITDELNESPENKFDYNLVLFFFFIYFFLKQFVVNVYILIKIQNKTKKK